MGLDGVYERFHPDDRERLVDLSENTATPGPARQHGHHDRIPLETQERRIQMAQRQYRGGPRSQNGKPTAHSRHFSRCHRPKGGGRGAARLGATTGPEE